MADIHDLEDLFRAFSLPHERVDFKTRSSLVVTAGGKVNGHRGGFVEFKFFGNGTFDRAGVYPRQKPDLTDIAPPPLGERP